MTITPMGVHLRAGDSLQFSSSSPNGKFNLPPGALGSITPLGFYIAPDNIPVNTIVTITCTDGAANNSILLFLDASSAANLPPIPILTNPPVEPPIQIPPENPPPITIPLPPPLVPPQSIQSTYIPSASIQWTKLFLQPDGSFAPLNPVTDNMNNSIMPLMVFIDRVIQFKELDYIRQPNDSVMPIHDWSNVISVIGMWILIE